jgi:uncharacterized RDD family membrane protein YckC
MDWWYEILALGANLAVAFFVWWYYKRRVFSRRVKYLTFGPRFWAPMVDACVLWPAAVFLAVVASLSLSPPIAALVRAVDVIVWFVYSVAMHAKYGQTYGKMVCGIKVLDYRTERPITVGQALRRDGIPVILYLMLLAYGVMVSVSRGLPSIAAWAVLMSLPLLWFLAEILTMFTNDKRRALHDWVAGTVVVRTNLRSVNESERLR